MVHDTTDDRRPFRFIPDEAREHAALLAQSRGLHFIGPFERELVAGVASYALELFRGAPPLVLAGGLTAENVAAAIAAVRPAAVDVASGVENAGRKDAEKMRRFVATARGEGDKVI